MYIQYMLSMNTINLQTAYIHVQYVYTNAVCGATQLSALHNYRDRCSGIAYKRYCGIGTLYFKILTLVTAIIWQPGH